jgi:hypothetical protein
MFPDRERRSMAQDEPAASGAEDYESSGGRRRTSGIFEAKRLEAVAHGAQRGGGVGLARWTLEDGSSEVADLLPGRGGQDLVEQELGREVRQCGRVELQRIEAQLPERDVDVPLQKASALREDMAHRLPAESQGPPKTLLSQVPHLHPALQVALHAAFRGQR